MFGIISCPVCSELQGFELSHRSVTCLSCGKRIRVDRTGSVGPFEDQTEMRKKLWDMKSGSMSKSEKNLKEEIFSIHAPEPKKRINRREREETVLSLIKEGFDDLDSLKEHLTDRDIDVDALEKILDSLASGNMIYSPGYGRYKVVEDQ